MLKLLFALAVLAIAGTAFYVYQGGSTARPAIPTVVTDASSGSRPAPTVAAGEVSVDVTEATLSKQLNDQLAGKPVGNTPLGQATLKNMAVQLKPGQMVTNGEASVGSTTLPVSATSTVDVQSGRPVVSVKDASVGSIALPDSVRQQIQAAVQSQLDQAISSSKLRVSSVTIGTGKMTIVGSRS